uniref:Rhamnogalacturonase A/B/Epimerase-like pectate lyase domain-containing protein n=1 Tax=Schlesneria paludicola TaxID=360056 RepID=A0A7C4LJ75_9PLAN
MKARFSHQFLAIACVYVGMSSPVIAADASNPDRVFIPADAGLVNVRDHGLKGDGKTDDTAALVELVRRNLNQHKTLFFPSGTYILSDSILWANEQGEFWPWLTWQGEGRGRTVLRLRDRSPGFGDATKPKPVVKTGCYDGETRQNAAFNCYFFDLTINTGRGNPGAIALDYCSHNNGGVVRVDLVSEDGAGVAGLSMTRDSPGPALIQHVNIRGFDTGIALKHLLFGVTFESVRLEKQNGVGMLVDGNAAAIRGLTSVN